MNKPLRIGLAVSGGADSTALLVLMARLQKAHNFQAIVLHVDHGIRSDSALDTHFVSSLAKHLKLPFHKKRIKVIRSSGESLEMAARRERLKYFSTMMRQLNLDAIATGHHADDVAETFLMRLARGSGSEGLAGLKRISHVNNITFIRPLLDLRDTQLREFLTHEGIAWREDSTNADTTILRNKVRHLIIPWLKRNLDAHITEHICKSAAILRGDLVRTQLDAPCEVTPIQRKTEKRHSPTFTLTITPTHGFIRHNQTIGQWPSCCEMNRHALAGRPLILRTWKAGDRFAPWGLNGKTRKLQDIFVTAKVPPALRSTLPLLVDGQTNEILWVPGYRAAQGTAVESPNAPSWHFELNENQAPDTKLRTHKTRICSSVASSE